MSVYPLSLYESSYLNKMRAMWESIEHWYDNWRIVNQRQWRISHYGNSCPLCKRYNNIMHRCADDVGTLCPIAMHADDVDCRGTPWGDVDDALDTIKFFHEEPTDQQLDVLYDSVVKEYEFLVDLTFENIENGPFDPETDVLGQAPLTTKKLQEIKNAVQEDTD